MADNLQKRPSKGILKNSSSFDKQDSRSSKKSKETKWDEMNIIATLHPADKDYGHMKIDEPKTPYNYEEHYDELDASELAEKIRLGSEKPPRAMQSNSDDDDDDDDDEDEMLTPDGRAKKKEFESKRKKHYNEFYAVKLARKLLEEEEDDEEEDASGSSTTNAAHTQPNANENSNHSQPE